MPLELHPKPLPPHVVKARQLTRRCVKLQLISLETDPSVNDREGVLLVTFSTQASRVTSTWTRSGWSKREIEMPACEVTVLTIEVDCNGTQLAGVQGPIQWFVDDQSMLYRLGLNEPVKTKLPLNDRPDDSMTLVMDVEESVFDLAVSTHKGWLAGSVHSLLLGNEQLPPSVPAIDPSLPTVPVANDEEVRAFLERYFHAFPEHDRTSVRLLNDGRILKYGSRVHFHEALVLKFIRERTSIPVPDVHFVFKVRDVTFIVMENVVGEDLDTLMEKDSIDDAQLGCIAEELVGYMQQIQRIIPPPDPDGRSFGSFPSGPYHNIYFDPPPPRRYKYIEELSMYLVSMTATNPVCPPLLKAGQQVPGVLAHGDLNPSNVMVKDGRISGIIDWDTFGSYPPWWEYMRAIRPWTRWDPIIRKEMDKAMNHGRIIYWDPSDDLMAAYYKAITLMLLKQESGHFGGG